MKRPTTAAWLLLASLFGPLPSACQQGTSTPTMPDAKYVGTTNAVPFPADMAWLNTAHPITLEQLRGKIVLLDFWTYCCINCIHVLPDLKRLEQEFPELVVVGVHSAKFRNEQDAENIRQAILRYDIEHPVAVDNEFYLWQQYAIRAWPSFALIDPNGKFVGQTSGEGIYARLQPILTEMRTTFAGQLNRERMHFALERERSPAGLLSYPGKIVADATRNRLIFTDSNHNRIIVATPEGKVLHVIGSGMPGQADGTFAEAQFFRPQGLAYDAARDLLYVADTDNHLVRVVDFNNRTVRTLLGTGKQASTYTRTANGTQDPLNSPWDLQLLDGKLYIAMAGPHQLWVMDPDTRQARVFAGSGQENIVDGPVDQAALAQPSGITTDGKRIYFADSETSSIRYVADGEVHTLVGEGLFEFGDVDGGYPKARLQHAIGVYYHQGKLLVADTYNHKIKELDPATRTLRTLLGTGDRGRADGKAAAAQFSEPNGLTFLGGKFYITDTNNGLIRVYDPTTGRVSTLTLQEPARLSMLEVKRKASASAADEVPFYGETVALPQATVAAGQQEVVVTVEAPQGYEWNPEAPNYVQAVSAAGQPQAAVTLTEQTLTARIPLHLAADAAGLVLEAGLYYCEHGERSRCLIKQVQLRVPLAFQPGAAPLAVRYRVPAPVSAAN